MTAAGSSAAAIRLDPRLKEERGMSSSIFHMTGITLGSMTRHIFYIVGVALLVLGGVSAVALFIRAVIGREKISEGPGIGTLWGLFVIGLVGGLVLLAVFAR
jgi:hypothetical protein